MSDVNKFEFSIPLNAPLNKKPDEEKEYEARRKPTSKFSTKEIRLQTEVEDTQNETMRTSSSAFYSAQSNSSSEDANGNIAADNISGNDSFASAESCGQYEDAKSTTEAT